MRRRLTACQANGLGPAPSVAGPGLCFAGAPFAPKNRGRFFGDFLQQGIATTIARWPAAEPCAAEREVLLTIGNGSNIVLAAADINPSQPPKEAKEMRTITLAAVL